MKTAPITAALCLLSTILCPPARGVQWQVKSDIPGIVYGHGAAVVNDRLYVIGGCETADWTKTSTKVQIYDPATDSWTRGPDLPVELGWPMVASHNGRIYVFGGMRSGAVSTDQAWLYDPGNKTWSPVASLPSKAMNGVAVASGDSIYVGLGYRRVDPSGAGVIENFRDFYRYDPARNSYTRLAEAPEGACYAAVGAFDDKIYVVPGAVYEIGFHDMKDYGWADGVLRYEPKADTWTKLNTPRIQPRVFFLTQCTSSAYHQEKLFVSGGQSHYRRTSTASYFDMKRELFFEMSSLPQPRCCGGGGVVGDNLILAGGFWGVGETNDPARPTWLLPVTHLPEPGHRVTNSIGMAFAYIPAGRFVMGSTWEEQDRQYDEQPHQVRLTKPIWMSTTEVTQGQWKAVMANNRSHFSGDDLPAETVSWADAVAFCEKLSHKEGKTYRLPTEAEWEFACRAGGDGKVAAGGSLDDLAWYARNSEERTRPVGTKKSNAWGLFDMLGNISEWCADTYLPEYSREEAIDPAVRSERGAKVVRGGSWASFTRSCRCQARNSMPAAYQEKETGFRVVMEALH